MKTQKTKVGKVCKYCGQIIYYSKYQKSYRCGIGCDKAQASETKFNN
jgi:hypothetical protein